MNAKLLKLAQKLKSQNISFYVQKFSLFLCPPPHFRLLRPHVGCSGDGTDWDKGKLSIANFLHIRQI